ncbi:hypothetical protein Tco_0696310 [Tanacetum coccineum]
MAPGNQRSVDDADLEGLRRNENGEAGDLELGDDVPVIELGMQVFVFNYCNNSGFLTVDVGVAATALL